VESRGILWTLVESRPVIIKVKILSESASYYDEVLEFDDEVSESNNKVEFLQIIK
jgi:hypothetical protein